ncbi:uncharacterized protein LOC110112596 isoform X2 [Dendrobium catenatum]|uniref:uncharacterized protein LOC110112596 isoform X1 n=1 Tax=Dendrobium catenatum TaxID=906689 RepID=UPI0009F438FD|nr:uncharacterized protein LOC110112596 isoform X1 [Dendrobium catenatum]XP_028550172.1 uncharacterized protein LOC110112596 isoform X2 [Dendrobium catenatum]
MSRGQPRPRSQSARRILRRCQNKGNIEDAIIIDDDTENADVVLIDNPNTSRKGSKHAKTTRLNCSPRGVIYIDDEGEDPRNSSTDTTTSNQFAETFYSLSLSDDSESDEYPMFGNGNVCCDNTGPSRNRYGLDLDSEDSMTQSNSLKYNTDECDEFDCSNSDCEIMEDHLGVIREQWEKAASRKKESGQFASTDQANAPDSTIYSEDPFHAPTLYNADVACCFKRTSFNYIDEILAKFGPSSKNAKQSPSDNVLPTYENEDFYFKDKANMFVPQSCSSSHIPCEESGTRRELDESNLGEYPKTTHSMDDGLSFINKDAQEPVKAFLFTCKSHGKTRLFDNEEPSTRTSYESSTWDGKHVSKDNDLCPDRAEHKLDEVSHSDQANHVMADKRVASNFEESKMRDYEGFSPSCSRQHEEPRIKTQNFTICGDVNAKMGKKVNAVSAITDMGLTSHKPDDMPHGYESLIGERERHKETDEYKRAAEEEWASRQRQLQIQAEEAQRLRKRRKAETMRLLDMEKRQKQRLEEIRDLQKKDEETIQLKERIRTEVIKDLKRVEMTCRDMASVLRALGIHVKGGFSPTVNEINAAYKQALLRFHPDRASRTDIRQQVEAEEKFKLISRLKEKLLL